MKVPKIKRATAINDTTLIIEFSDQDIKHYDITRLWPIPLFAPLKQPAFFRQFTIEAGGHGLCWNADLDISEYELWKNGESLTSEVLELVKAADDLDAIRDDPRFQALLHSPHPATETGS
jgi:hypothetical protein